MKHRIQLEDDEFELIMAVRNLRKAYPNGYERLLYYAKQLFDAITDLP